RLAAGGYGADLREAFARHLHRYGDRGLEEVKMERPNLRRTPWELLALTAPDAHPRLTGDAPRRQERDSRARAPACLEEALAAGSARVAVLGLLLDRLGRCVRYRENSRYCRSEWFGVAKEIFASLGADLAARGVLRDAADVVHLTLDELLGWYDATGVSA